MTVNALSPIANTRMVAAALERARQEGRAGGGGGLTLDSMPGPEQLGPLGAHLVEDSFGWCTGQVVFASGPEVAIVDQPRLMEVVRTTGAASLRALLAAFVPRALAKAEANQASAGGGNPRFGSIFDEPGARPGARAAAAKTCVVVADGRPELAAPLIAALEARSITCHRVEAAADFAGAADALRAVVDAAGTGRCRSSLALDGHPPAAATTDRLGIDPRRSPRDRRAPARRRRLGAGGGRLRRARRPSGPAGDPDRQPPARPAAAGPRRPRSWPGSAASGTDGRVTAFAASIEAPDADAGPVVGELVGHLLAEPEAAAAGRRRARGRARVARPAQPPPAPRHRDLRRSRRSRLARRRPPGDGRRRRAADQTEAP